MASSSLMNKEPKYRLLEVGEVIQKGDEWYTDTPNLRQLPPWYPVYDDSISKKVEKEHPPIRRKLE